jgi:predicted AAA+ superfamily ATPase
MDRFIIKKLIAWKTQPHRKPLIFRGARQVGKTWAVLDFAKKHFEGKVHVIDLEKHPEWHRIFEVNLDARRIVADLEIVLATSIQPGRDLLFIDEIQNCPRALMALRYFYEEYAELHVIAAGSLLEFAMKEISFPVGRVQFLNLFPMSFPEFLIATGKDKAADLILSPPKKQAEYIHEMLLAELKKYFFVGGMPECVRVFAETGKIRDALSIQVDLIRTFREDFSKYTPQVDKQCLNAVLSATAQRVGKQIIYSHLADGFTNPTLKRAFGLLNMAQLIHRVPNADPAGLPLGASASEKKLKAIMVDIGLMHSLSGLPVDVEYQKSDLLAIYQGAMAEQFVGQELLAAGQPELYYWSRDAKSSTAEVDFLINKQGRIFPIEVKSGPSGRLKSLHLLLSNYTNISSGYVLSTQNYVELPEQKLTFLPLYYAYQLGMVD